MVRGWVVACECAWGQRRWGAVAAQLGRERGRGLNTLELSLLEGCDEQELTAVVVAFVRRRRRLPRLEELVPELVDNIMDVSSSPRRQCFKGHDVGSRSRVV